MRSMPTTATATAVGAALRRCWEDRTPAGPVDAVLTEALLASLDVLLPGLGAAVRVEVLRGDIVRPDPARGPLNALLAVLADALAQAAEREAERQRRKEAREARRIGREGRLPTPEEYLGYAKGLEAEKSTIYNYLNFDRMPTYVEAADKARHLPIMQ